MTIPPFNPSLAHLVNLTLGSGLRKCIGRYPISPGVSFDDVWASITFNPEIASDRVAAEEVLRRLERKYREYYAPLDEIPIPFDELDQEGEA